MNIKAKRKAKRKKPNFLRQEWFRHGNIRKKWLKWRRPRGKQSKLRRGVKGKGFIATPGYGTIASLRGLHPSGLNEVLIHTIGELKSIDSKTHAVRIGKTVGKKKRIAIQDEAQKMKLKVLNPKKLKLKVKKVEKKAEKKAEAPKKEAKAPKEEKKGEKK